VGSRGTKEVRNFNSVHIDISFKKIFRKRSTHFSELCTAYILSYVCTRCIICTFSYNRLRSSAVLVVGLTGLTAELIKNIVLAGIKLLTLIDHRNGDENTVNNIQGATFLLLPSECNKSTPVSYNLCYTIVHFYGMQVIS